MVKEAKFFLHEPKSTAPTYIFLKYSCSDGMLKYSTQEKALATDWNLKLQRSQSDKKINTVLNRLHGIVERYQETCKLAGKPVKVDELRAELNGITNRVERRKNLNFFHYIEILINEAETGKLLTPLRTKYSPGSVANFKKSRNLLQEFMPGMEFDSITISTYFEFIQFLNLKGYSANYAGKLIKDWKTFMNLAFARKWHSNLVYKDPEFKKPGELSFQVYLDEKEIAAIMKLDLSKRRNLEIIRDRFIVNLYTGLRISDMKTLSIDNIQNEMVTHINQKTGKKVVIPVHKHLFDIIEKYNGVLPKQYNDRTVNQELKNIVREAGINETVRFTRTVGGKKKQFAVEKWRLITNHSARRSLATNLLKHIDIQQGQQVLGMSLRTLQHYNKITPEQNAEVIKGNQFFKK